jgi:hypothetical protein
MDATPTTGSSKPVTSGGIKAALDLIDEDISSLNEDITNLETNKQDVLTFDSAPTAESTNPVTSAGIKTALDSVDAEIGELKSAIDNIAEFSLGKNLYNTATQSTGMLKSDGDVNTSQTSYVTSDFIPVEASTTYFFSERENASQTVVTKTRYLAIQFNANREVISNTFQNIDATTGLTIATTDTAAFIRVSVHYFDNFVLQVEKGASLTKYEPYTVNAEIIAKLGDTPREEVEEIANGVIAESGLIDEVVGKNIIPNSFVDGVINSNGSITSTGSYANYETSDFIPVSPSTNYVFSTFNSSTYVVSTTRKFVNVFDENKEPVGNGYQNVDGETDVVISTGANGKYVRVSSQKAVLKQLELGIVHTGYSPYEKNTIINVKLGDVPFAQVDSLYGKTWAVLGDSFTNGVLSTRIATGKYAGQKIVYPYLIGNRTGINVLRFFDSGKTLAWPAEPGTFTNSVTNPNADMYYQNIPSDVDYITIYLGINDEHHSPRSSGGDGEDNTGEIPIGTASDNTTATYYGAWNVVLTWLITNRPNAHIGIIVTNGISGNDNYRLAQIEMATKYGIPYIDLNGDSRTPAMLRTSNPNIPADIKTALITKWRVSSSNTHPNDAAHIFESTCIENFLRSL